MPTHRFQEVTWTAIRQGRCQLCDKPVRRRHTFWATVNPWNRREDGTAKIYAEVLQEVKNIAAAWNPGPEVFEHTKCRQAHAATAPT